MKLEPCPAWGCGATPTIERVGQQYQVVCLCDMSGSCGLSAADAAEEWNDLAQVAARGRENDADA